MVDSRHIRTLRLTSPDHDAALQGRRVVADALKMATLPGDGLPGRLLIRHLELGPCPTVLGSRPLAERLGAAVRRAHASAVWFAAAEAPAASAVLAPAGVDGWIEIARRACAPRPLDLGAWFWPLLLPGLAPGGDRSSALEACVDALLAAETPVPAASVLLARLIDDGTSAALLEALGEARARRLLRASRIAEAAATGRGPERVRPPRGAANGSTSSELDGLRFAPRWQAVLVDFVGRWGPRDLRSVWLCFSALWTASPARATTLGASAHVHHIARTFARWGSTASVAATRREASRTPTPEPAHGELAAASARDAVAAPSDESSPEPRQQARSSPESHERERDRPPRGAGASEPPAPKRNPAGAPQPSVAAGFFFLLCVLERLGFRRFAHDHPQLARADLLARVLHRFADAACLAENDPARAALPALSEPPPRCEFQVPAAWLGELVLAEAPLVSRRTPTEPEHGVALADGMPLALWPDEPPALLRPRLAGAATSQQPYPAERAIDVAVDAWQQAAVRWLAQSTDLDVETLICRDGGLLLRATTLDVIFELDRADIRVRRAALDLDPGYVPELGRVVKFHYLRDARTAWSELG